MRDIGHKIIGELDVGSDDCYKYLYFYSGHFSIYIFFLSIYIFFLSLGLTVALLNGMFLKSEWFLKRLCLIGFLASSHF